MGCGNSMCQSTTRLDGKTVIITGCNTGIGKITTRDMYQRGAKVIMACRNLEKAKKAVQEIKEECSNMLHVGDLDVTALDLTSLKSVRSCAHKLLHSEQRIDILINNAGVMVTPFSRTEDGFEMQLGTNHLGHFLFTLLLLPKIIKSTPVRIVNVSSLAHIFGSINFNDINWETRWYSASFAYAQSKLANVLFTKELDRRLKEANINNVNIYSLHPGVIKTELTRNIGTTYFSLLGYVASGLMRLFKTPEQGAQTTIYCAVSEEAGKESGLYYSECAKKTPSRAARNENTAKRLWDVSLKLVGLEENYNPFVNIPSPVISTNEHVSDIITALQPQNQFVVKNRQIPLIDDVIESEAYPTINVPI